MYLVSRRGQQRCQREQGLGCRIWVFCGSDGNSWTWPDGGAFGFEMAIRACCPMWLPVPSRVLYIGDRYHPKGTLVNAQPETTMSSDLVYSNSRTLEEEWQYRAENRLPLRTAPLLPRIAANGPAKSWRKIANCSRCSLTPSPQGIWRGTLRCPALMLDLMFLCVGTAGNARSTRPCRLVLSIASHE